MSEWFYAQGDQRLGPVGADAIAAMFDRGELSAETLVWTEGMSEWRALRDVSSELGIEPVRESVPPAIVMTEPVSPYAAPATTAPLHAPPQQGGDVVMAGFWKRFAASTIDSFLLGAVSLIIVFVCLMLAGGAAALTAQGLANEMAQGTVGVAAIVLIYVLPIVVQIIYFTWMHASASQATLGKLAVGIKVARGDGSGLTLGRSFGRWCAYFFINLATCGVGTLVSAFTSGLTDRKQGLHDMMADTLVVDRWAFTAHPERQRRELGAVTWAMIIIAGLFIVGYFAFLLFAIGMAAVGAGHTS